MAPCCLLLQTDPLLGRLGLFSFLLSPPRKITNHFFMRIHELASYLRLEKPPLATVRFPFPIHFNKALVTLKTCRKMLSIQSIKPNFL